MAGLLKSVNPLSTSLEGFQIFIFPTIVLTILAHRKMSERYLILFSILMGVLFSVLDLIHISLANMGFFLRQLWVYVSVGGIAGLAYGFIIDFPLRKASPHDSEVNDVLERRKFLGFIGLFAGSAGLLGSMAGPLYFWRNQNKFIDVNVALLKEGEYFAVNVANRPVWILKRSPAVIRMLEQDNPRLLDPDSQASKQPEQARNPLRSIRPEYLVVYGVCTHLGCVPTYKPSGRGDQDNNSLESHFYCPCHGGVFDLSGRVYIGTPPPVNLTVPSYEFVSDEVIRVYHPTLAEEWNA